MAARRCASINRRAIPKTVVSQSQAKNGRNSGNSCIHAKIIIMGVERKAGSKDRPPHHYKSQFLPLPPATSLLPPGLKAGPAPPTPTAAEDPQRPRYQLKHAGHQPKAESRGGTRSSMAKPFRQRKGYTERWLVSDEVIEDKVREPSNTRRQKQPEASPPLPDGDVAVTPGALDRPPLVSFFPSVVSR
ncbi:hypothetical protein B0H10DRAFT_1952424 [Mycena sp. CBHHK59/15]|nr:hypothetical protein B0H10DRAFT_1952424 [Mycena sp. CBHHK59/15]